MPLVPFAEDAATEGRTLPEPLPSRAEEDLDEPEETGARMTFLEHLDELRRRIIYSVISIGVGFLIAFIFIQQIFDFIMRPLQQALPKGGKLVYTEPTEAFVLYLKIALLAGIILAAPLVLWQVWLFISPGLYQKEKRFAIPFVVLGTSGFLLGGLFSHYLLFPWTWRFLASFSTDYMMFMPKIEPVFSLYSKMLLGMGLVFQMPTIVFFLSKMGLVTAKFLLKNIKYAILIIFIAAAVITPTGDMLTQTLFAAPMVGLYLVSILIAWIFGKKKRPTTE